jgi:predicted phage-related endonuclease
MESAQERALNKLFGNYSNPNPNKNAALTALDKSIEDRIVYETTLQVLQLQDNKDLQQRIASKVNEQVDIAIARAASRVAEEYVKNLFAKYETEKLLLIASEPDKEEP